MSVTTATADTLFASLQDAPVGIAVVSLDPPGRILRVNRTLCRLLGHTEEDLLGLCLEDLADPADRDALAAEDEHGCGAEGSYRRRDGTSLRMLVSIVPLLGASNLPEARLAMFLDVTDRHDAVDRLERSEQRFRDVVESTRDGFYELDADRRITYINARMAEMLGYRPEEMLGARLERFLFEEDIPEWLRLRRLRTEGEHQQGVEFRLRRRDGSAMWASFSMTINTDAAGRRRRAFSLVRDVTEQRRAREELARAVELQRALAGNLPDTLAMLFDRDLRYLLIEGADVRRQIIEHLIGRTVLEHPLLDEDHREMLARHYRAALAGERQEYDHEIAGRVLHATITPVRDADGTIYAGLVVSQDVTAQRRDAERLERLARFDTLTGLPNRATFLERLDDVLAAAHRSPAALMFMDLDNFKDVNDSLGHDAGDELLCEAARRLQRSVRPGDLVARLSGDEFTVLLERVQNEDQAREVAQRIIRNVREPVKLAEHETFPGVSIGIALLPRDGTTRGGVLRAADAAMYAAKRQGRDGYRFFSSELTEAVESRMRLSAELHRAVQRREFVLHYQPQLALPQEEIVSVEALVRWQHPTRGLLPPVEFIPAAEEAGLIVELGERVLREACEQMMRWRRAGIIVPRVAVNVATHQLNHGDFPQIVRCALASSGLPPEALQLEITESALMDPVHAPAVLQALRSIGVSIAIDDFGTGYSSLARLRQMPIDLLKIDRAFVADIDRDPDDAAVVRAIIGLAHNMGIRALAEGVERPAQRDLLVSEGCDDAGGWLWAPALEPDELADWAAAALDGRKRTLAVENEDCGITIDCVS